MSSGDNEQPDKPEKKPYVPARTVYIGLRRYDLTKKRAVPCRGLCVRAYDFTPEEVHAAILDGLQRMAERYQREQLEKGEKPNAGP